MAGETLCCLQLPSGGASLVHFRSKSFTATHWSMWLKNWVVMTAFHWCVVFVGSWWSVLSLSLVSVGWWCCSCTAHISGLRLQLTANQFWKNNLWSLWSFNGLCRCSFSGSWEQRIECERSVLWERERERDTDRCLWKHSHCYYRFESQTG